MRLYKIYDINIFLLNNHYISKIQQSFFEGVFLQILFREITMKSVCIYSCYYFEITDAKLILY